MKEFKTLEEFQDIIKDYKGTLVLHYFEVVRLVDVTEDQDDFYYVFNSKTGRTWVSCLLSCVPLKGTLSDEDYNELERVWKLNNYDNI